jgi:rhodanese-related sulfurtransferase
MGFLEALRKTFAKPAPDQAISDEKQPARPEEPAPIVVPEVHAVELMEAYGVAGGPQLLDCREQYEWQQVRIPGSVHIPMNQIPRRLTELDPTQEWVVVCAHGNRSLDVAGYLIHNGYRASSLAGGVTDWWMRGGQTEGNFRR